MALNYQNIIEATLQKFPEYKNTDYYENNDKELPYSFFFGFSEYITEKIQESNNPVLDELIKKAFDFFNEMIESTDEKVSTLAVTEILENLVQDKKSKDVTVKLLREPGKEYLAKVLKFTGVDN